VSTVRLVLVAFGTAAYAGLAILGWGGFRAFFSHPALVALVIALFVMSGVALFAGGNPSPGVREDRSNRWVISVFALIGLLNAYVPAHTDRTEFWTIDGDVIRWLGIGLFAAGGALRLWPVFVLGQRFSGLVAIQPQSSRDTRSSSAASMVSSATPATWACSSIHWAGAWRFVRELGC